MEFKRFETTVIQGGKYFSFKHRGVVYYAKAKDDRETILLAANHRWREGYLMVVISPKDIDDKEAHRLINYYANAYIACQRCLRSWDGGISFRIDVRRGEPGHVVCAYCDPTVFDMVLPFDYQEVARDACKHRHS